MLAFNNENKFTRYLFWRALFMSITVITVIVGSLLLSGHTIISNSDSLNQHIQVFGRFHEYLVTFLTNPSQFGTWDWTLSNGTDWYNAFSYYILGDPLGYLMIFFNDHHTILGYEIIVFLRFILAGISVAYCATKFGIKRNWLSVVIVSYLCTLFGIYGLLNQSLFLNALIYLPVLLVAVEKYFTSGEFKLLTVLVALTIASNFYWGIILAEIIAIYAVITYVFNYFKTDKHPVKTWTLLVGTVILGIGLASIVLVPMVVYLLTSPRNGSGLKELFSLYPIEYYLKLLTLPFGLMGVNQPSSFWLQGTASAINTVGFFGIIIRRRQNKMLFIILLITIGLLVFPGAAVLLTIGNTPTNRWMMIIYLLTALSGTFLLHERAFLTKGERYQMAWVLGIGTLVYLYLSQVNQIDSSQVIGYLCTLTIVAIFMLLPKLDHVNERWLKIGIIGGTFFTVIMQLYFPMQKGNALKLLSQHRVYQIVKEPTGLEHLFSPALTARTEFANGIRTKSNDMFINTFLTNAHGTGLYLSTANPSMIDFSQKMALISGRTVNPLRNLDNRFILTNYFGANQIVSSAGNKTANLPGLKKVATSGHLNLYQNKYAFPILWIANGDYNQKYFNQANPVEKENLLAADKVAVIDGQKIKPPMVGLEPLQAKIEFKQAIGDKLNHKKVHYQVKKISNPEQEMIINVRNVHSKLQLKLPKSEGKGELLLYLSNLEYIPPTIDQMRTQKQSFRKIQQQYLYRNDGYMLTTSGGNRKVDFEQLSTSSGAFYQLRKDGVINLGIMKKMPSQVTLSFNKVGTYKLKVKVYKQNINQPIIKQLNSIDKQKISSLSFSYQGISGIIPKKHSNWIASNIPYSSGWSAKVGDEVVKVQRINGDFLGIKVNQAASKVIKLKYQTPGLRIGTLISVISFIILIFLDRKNLRFYNKINIVK